ncbi:MAG: hypothetical protein RL417_1489 [Pseudomonadota bacterium]
MRRVIDFMHSHPTVQWLGETLGERRFEATLWVRTPLGLTAFFEEMGRVTGSNLVDRIMTLEGDVWLWGHRCFSEKCARVIPLHFDTAGDPFAVDELDGRIINVRRTSGFPDPAKIARLLRVPSTTVTYRINKLYRERVLVDGFLVERRSDNIREGHLLLEVRSHDAARHARILAACQAHAVVGGLIRCAGSWDYKVVLLGSDSVSLLKGEAKLRRELESEINRMTLVIRRGLLKFCGDLKF